MNFTEKHTHIIRKAEILFAEKGFEGTTVRDIAQAADVNLAMISYYFGSKEKLIEALFVYRMGEVKLSIQSVVNNQGIHPFQKIVVLIDQYIERVFDNQDFYKVLFTEQVLNKNRAVINAIKMYKSEFIAMISQVLEEGLKLGMFKYQADTMLLLTSMTGSVMQMVINKDFYKEVNQLTKMKEETYDSLLKEKLSLHIKQIFKATLGYEL